MCLCLSVNSLNRFPLDDYSNLYYRFVWEILVPLLMPNCVHATILINNNIIVIEYQLLNESNLILRVTPVFTASCVTGENLDLVKRFLNLVPPARSPLDQEKLAQEYAEYQVCFCLLISFITLREAWNFGNILGNNNYYK